MGVPVFIADDEDIVGRLLVHMLVRLDCSPVLFHSGEELIDRIRVNHLPAFVIMDVELPGLSGIQILKRLRQTCPTLPAILMSGNPLPEDTEPVEFLEKPFSMGELNDAVQHCLHPTSA